MKIGIMGGTFAPIHNGHLMLGEYAYRQFDLDEIWYMPNGHPPHKNDPHIEEMTRHRVEMTRLAIRETPYFRLSTYETEQNRLSYSYQTMEELNRLYPEDEFFFIIGADSLFAIEIWGHPERLLVSCTMLAAFRDGKSTEEMSAQIAYLNKKYHARIRLLRTLSMDISSHEIRERIQNHLPITDMVPEAVADYIARHHLFEEKDHVF